MPRSSSKSKSLPPLPIVAAHVGLGASANLSAAHPPHAPSAGNNSTENPESATTTRRRSCAVTNGCIRTTVTLFVFGAYLVWTWPWHREHGFEDIPWLGHGRRGGNRSSEARAPALEAEVAVGGEVEGALSAPELGVPEEIQAKWGQYAPYRAMGTYVGAPEGCIVTQVSRDCVLLQRHGARYPNLKEGEQYAATVRRLGSAKKFKDKRLEFLKHYHYDLSADDLTPFGAAQTFESGQLAFDRYRHLVDDHNIPFVRASGAPRVVDSAGNWSAGFAAASRQRYQPYVNVALPEDVNSTLKQDCPNADDGSTQMDTWLSVFAPRLLKRFNKAAPGVKLDTSMVFDLMAMCPFESVAKLWERGGSPFCALFDEEDFRDFEYHGDVEKYYKDGCVSLVCLAAHVVWSCGPTRRVVLSQRNKHGLHLGSEEWYGQWSIVPEGGWCVLQQESSTAGTCFAHRYSSNIFCSSIHPHARNKLVQEIQIFTRKYHRPPSCTPSQ
ncbi:hypothetical protein V8D89_005146 [Ganoderma adspersum]